MTAFTSSPPSRSPSSFASARRAPSKCSSTSWPASPNTIPRSTPSSGLDGERARKRAAAADAALAKGEVWGPLHGVPMTLKESYTFAGSPTTWGVPELEHNVTETSALAVERLEKAGVVVFGKTNVPILLADWQSYNAIYGTCNNPWDVDAYAGRLVGRLRGGAGSRPHRHRCRQRHRCLHSQSRALLRRVRPEADLGRHLAEGTRNAGLIRLRRHLGHRPAGARRGGPGRGARRHGRARRDRRRRLEARAAGLPGEIAQGPANCSEAARSQFGDRRPLRRSAADAGRCARQARSDGQGRSSPSSTRAGCTRSTCCCCARPPRRGPPRPTSSAGARRWLCMARRKSPTLHRWYGGTTLLHSDWLKLNNERHGLRRTFAPSSRTGTSCCVPLPPRPPGRTTSSRIAGP